MTHSSWRAAALDAVTRTAYAVFRRSPLGARRVLIRMLTPNYTVGAVAACVDAAGRVLLVRSRQHHGWGLPGGLVRRGEEPVDGLVREIEEELSIVIPADELASLRRRTVIDPTTQQVTVVFAVTLASPPSVDGTEVMEARWFAESEIPTSLVRGTYESLQAIGAVAPRVTR